MTSRPAAISRTNDRRQLVRAIGRGVSRFQEASYAFDDVAAEILALNRSDLPCMTLLLFDGPSTADALAVALHLPRSVVTATLARMQLAGYARFQPGGGARIELTEHARGWIERIWADLRREGGRVLGEYPTRDLMLVSTFLRQASEIQESRTNKLRVWLARPSSPARRSHLRGGLSPAALRRVQSFVEANLARPVHLHDLAARAALSPYHFSRAFKTSAGTTPRAFVEDRRIERAKRLLRGTTQAVAAIAAETGFGTQSRLTTVFKHRTGFTPASYRRGNSTPSSRGDVDS
jgi:AraC family transcriptional regulator